MGSWLAGETVTPTLTLTGHYEAGDRSGDIPVAHNWSMVPTSIMTQDRLEL